MKKEDVNHRRSPSGAEVYQAIVEEGQTELARSSNALWWSGLAAGLSMGFSFVATALLHARLPQEASWVPLVTAFGYALGFVIVILGRQQLFTEDTLTVVLPLLRRKNGRTLKNVLRLWAVVLLANVTGALLFALVLAKTEAVDADVFASMRTIAKQAHMHSFGVTFLRAIFAGWLIALVVWLLPFAESARVLVIVLMTWIIGAAHFSHIIAGAVDSAFITFLGEQSWAEFAIGFFIPTLLGNMAGGISLVAAINHAQVVGGAPEPHR